MPLSPPRRVLVFTVVACLLGAAGPGFAAAPEAAAAQPHHHLVTAPVTTVGTTTASFVEDRGLVAVLELAGDYDRNDGEGGANTHPRAALAREYLAHHPDDYDFLVFFTTFPFDAGPARAFAWVVRNDVEGIGMPLFDNGADFGSEGRLQSVVDMAHLESWATGPEDPGFDRTLTVLAHEVLHRWGAHVSVRRPDGTVGNDLLGPDGSHWSFLLDTDASVLYGNDWRDNGDGTFTTRGALKLFSPLDLYLAGWLPPEEVPPFFLVETAEAATDRLPEVGVTVAGEGREVRIEDVVAAEGPRVPAAGEAPRRFRAAFALVARPGEAVTDAQVAAVDRVRRGIESRFAALTGGRAVLQVEPRAVPVAPPGEADPLAPGSPVAGDGTLAAGLAWLRNRQAAEGWWEDRPGTRVRDTAEVLATLAALDPSFSGDGDARAWLAGRGAGSIDDRARVARVLAASGTGTPVADLEALQNPDGGWGAGAGFASSPLDTALAVRALAAAGGAPAAVERGVEYLLAVNNPDGSWGSAPGTPGRTGVAASVVAALRAAGREADLPAATVPWLVSRQNPDGGFGDSPSTVHDTALALAALMDVGRLGESDAAAAQAYLRSRQGSDGDWAGSVYATALAVTVLKRAAFPNWRFAGAPVAEPADPSDGRTVTLTFRVENDGSAPAPPGLLRLFDGAPEDGGGEIETTPVPGLGAGQAVDLSLTWDTLDLAGDHVLVAVLDPEGATEELSETDNRTSLPLTVASAPDGTDLQVVAEEVLVSPARPVSLPADLAVAATVRNLGRTSAADVLVRLWAGTPLQLQEGAGRLVEEKRVAVPERSSTVAGFSYVLELAERVDLLVEVDPDGEIGEADETNNAATVTVTPGTGVDLAVGEVTLEGPALVGTEVLFRVSLLNRGTEGASGVEVSYRLVDGSGAEEEIGFQTVLLDAGAEEVRELPWRVDRSGALTFVAVMDPADGVAEADETNNRAELPFTASGGDTPNLVIEPGALVFTPDPALEGQPAVYSATVANLGGGASGPVEVAFYEGDPDQGGRQIGAVQEIEAMPAGGSATVSVPREAFTGSGDRLVFAVADPADRVAELAEDDNRTFASLAVLRRPDLAVSPSSVAVEPVLPRPGEAMAVTVTVANLGEQAAPGVVVRLESGGVPFAPDVAVGEVAGGSTAAAVFTGTFPAHGEPILLVATVDPAGAVTAETFRANNRAERPVAPFDTTVPVQPPIFSPDGDGVQDTALFSVALPVPAVAVEVRDGRGRVVRRHDFSGPVAQVGWVWDGRGDDQRVVADGSYALVAVGSGGGEAFSAPVGVDTDRSPLLDSVGTPFERVVNLACGFFRPGDVRLPLADDQVFFTANGYEGGPLTRATPPGSRDFERLVDMEVLSLRVSRDGEKVAFTTYEGWPGEKWYANADGSGVQRIYQSSRGDRTSSSFGFRGDSQKLVYYRYDDATIYERDLSGASPERVVLSYPVPHPAARRPEVWFYGFSPDGSHLLMERCLNGCSAPQILDLDSGETVEVPELDRWDGLAWSPDGRRIAAVEERISVPGSDWWHGRITVVGVSGEVERVVWFPMDFMADLPIYDSFGVDLRGPWLDVLGIMGPSWSDSGEELVAGAVYYEEGSDHLAEFTRLFRLDVTTGDLEDVGFTEPGFHLFSFHVSTWDGTAWVERGVLHHSQRFEQRALDLAPFLPDPDGEYKVRIRQRGLDAAHVDRVGMLAGSGPGRDPAELLPVSARRLPEGADVLELVTQADREVLDLHEGEVELRWESPEQEPARDELTLVLLAREEELDGRDDVPFAYPPGADGTGREAGTYQHRVGGGAPLRVDGRITAADALGEPLFQEHSVPDTGHPNATVSGWVSSDDEALYALLDFTVDNTVDGERDWASLEVETAQGWRELRVTAGDRTWGEVGFVHTAGASWRHKVYEFRVPLAEVGLAPGDNVSLRFRAYGTAALLPGGWELFGAGGYGGDVLWVPGSRHVLYWSDESGYTYSIDLDDGNRGERILTRFNTFSDAGFSASGKKLLFRDMAQVSEPDHECHHPSSFAWPALFALDSLANLAAELYGEASPGGAGIVLSGTATDLHFARWWLEYAREEVPGFWTPIAPASDVPVVDGVFTTWVPPEPGGYRVRLTVEDRAGNRKRVQRRFASATGSTTALTDVWVSPALISPDGDGHLDAATLHYRVLAPVILEVAVIDDAGARVRTFRRQHSVVGEEHGLVWNGRDDAGRPLPDGVYRVEVGGFRFPVELDTTPPSITKLEVDGPLSTVRIGAGSYFQPLPRVSYRLSDENPAGGLLEVGVGEAPLRWTPVVVTPDLGASCDDTGCAGTVSLETFTGNRLRLDAVDGAGNRARRTTDVAPERLGLWALGPQRQVPADARVVVDGGMARLELSRQAAVDRAPLRLRIAESVVPRLVAASLDFCVPAGGGCGVADWRAAERVQVLDPATGLPATEVPGPQLDLSWDLPAEIDAEVAAVLVRVRAVDDQGRVFLSDVVDLRLGGGLGFRGLFERIDGPPSSRLLSAAGAAGLDLDQDRVLWGRETFPEALTDVTLFLASEDDPRYAEPQPLPLAGAALGTMVFDGTDLAPCRTYRGWIAGRTVPLLEGDESRAVRSPDTVFRVPCLELAVELPADDPACGAVAPAVRTVRLTALSHDGAEPALLSLALGDPDDLLFTRSRPVPGAPYEVAVDTSGLDPGAHLLIARLTDGEGAAVEVQRVLVVDPSPPIVTLTYPLPGQALCPQTLGPGLAGVPILGRVTDRGSGEGTGNGRVSGLQPHLQLRWAGSEDWFLPPEPETPETATWILDFPQELPQARLPFGWEPFAPPTDREVEGELNVVEWHPGGLAGDLEVRLSAVDGAGNVACTAPVRFHLDGQVSARSVAVETALLSPDGDGRADATRLTFTADEPVVVDVEIYAGQELITLSGTQVLAQGPRLRTVVGGLSTAGGGDAVWDGRSDGGVVVPDGLYAVVFRFTDGCGNALELVRGVEVDLTPPVVALDAPLAGAELGQIVEVLGTVTDPHLLDWRVEYGLGTEPFTWSAVGGDSRNVRSDLLAVWNTLGLEGSLTLRLVARDVVGNESQALLPVSVPARDPLLTELAVAPAAFSPNGDGVLDTTAVRFGLSRPATVRLEVVDGGGAVVRTLVDGEELPEGSASRTWDGRDDAGVPAPDGDHRLRIGLTGSADPSRQQVETVAVAVDREPPVLVIERPRDGVAPGTAAVLGSVTDPHLVSWSVALADDPAFPDWRLLAEGEAEVVDGELATWSGLAPGRWAVRVRAMDGAGNRTEWVTDFEVDEGAPAVALTTPAEGTVAGAAGGPLRVAGWATDPNLRRWLLEMGAGLAPSSWTTVATGGDAAGSAGAPAALADLDLAVLADGVYTLRLTGEDLGGLTAETAVVLWVDGTPPAALLTAPAAGAFLTGPTAVRGTAADDHLVQYVLEVAPSIAGPYSELGRSTVPVVDGALLDWQVLPSDGAWVLRLTAVDEAGNRSAATVPVTVDRSPPAAPTGLVASAADTGVQLTWNANGEPDLVGYHLYRNGVRVTSAALSDPSFLDQEAREGRFTFTVTAIDEAGGESDPSAPVEISIDRTAPRAVLHRPAAGARVGGAVDVVVTATSDDLREYRLSAVPAAGGAPVELRRSSAPVVFAVAATWDTGPLAEESAWTLRLEAEDLEGNVAVVDAPVTVDNTPPPVPTGLVATLSGADATLAWDPVAAADLAGYLVYRDGVLLLAGVGDGLVGRALSDPSYLDAELPDGTFDYSVRAIDLAGNLSAPSAPAEVSLDRRAPAAVLVEPGDGERFDRPVFLRATTVDGDVATVAFEVRPAADSAWEPVESVTGGPPWGTTWDPAARPYGDYVLRAVATDAADRTDPAPAEITVTYVDLTRPAPVTDLALAVDGGRVDLTWSAVDDADLAGYRVERTGEEGGAVLLTLDPQLDAGFTDDGLADGLYTWRVWSEDVHGNVSTAVVSRAGVIYSPELERPWTPTRETSTAVVGVARPDATVLLELPAPGGPGPVAADADGVFGFAPVPLVRGSNRLSVVASDEIGDRSKAAVLDVVSALPPPAPQNLAAAVAGYDVELAWNPVPEAVGYRPFRNGEALLPEEWVADFDGAEASSVSGGFYRADRAIDSGSFTYWAPRVDEQAPAAGQWLSVTWPTPRQVRGVEIDWYDASYRALDFDLQVWDGGGWLTAVTVRGTEEGFTGVVLPEPYRTTGLRLLFHRIFSSPDVSFRPLRVENLEVLYQPLVASPPFADVAPDGLHAYTVTAVAATGFESAPSNLAEAAVGDAVGPDPVVLSGILEGADAVLSWSASVAPDLVRYDVLRDGVAVGTVAAGDARTFRDGPLANGTWTWEVRGVDGVGNPGPLSNPVVLTVDRELPGAPRNLAVDPVPSGGSLDLTWSPPETGAPVVLYRVMVSETPGGPYQASGEVAASPFRAAGLENGREYFFVVHAVDAAGNRGPASGEASGTPRDDLPPPPPRILYPAAPGMPYVTTETEVPLVIGIAEAGSEVTLLWEGAPVAQATAEGGAVVEELEAAMIGWDADPLPSPDGRWLLLQASWEQRLFHLGSGTETPFSALEWTYGWMGDGRRLLGSVYDWPYERVTTHDVVSGETEELFGADRINHAVASPNGRRVLLAAEKDGLEGLLLVDLEDGSVRELVASRWTDPHYASLSWSPDGTAVAYLSRGADELRWVDLSSGAVAVLDGDPGEWSAPVFAPRGDAVYYTSYDGGSVSRAFRHDLATGDRVELPASGGDVSFLQVSPDGSSLAYLLEETWLEILDLDAGTVERHYEMRSGAFARDWGRVQWTRGGDLFLMDDEVNLRLRPAGRFEVPGVALRFGDNRFTAVARDGAGFEGEPSEPVLIRVLTDSLPDLVVPAEGLSVLPGVVVEGRPVVLGARVENRGGAGTPLVEMDLLLRRPDGTLRVVEQGLALDPIGPGASRTVSRQVVPDGGPGFYTLLVAADPRNQVREANETDNRAERSFPVVSRAAPALFADTDRDAYGGAEPVAVRLDVANAGGDLAAARLEVRIEDADGFLVEELPALELGTVPSGAVLSRSLAWNTGDVFAGAYRAAARLVAAGSEVAMAAAPFVVTDASRLAVRVVTGAASYVPGDAVAIRGEVSYESGNVALSGAVLLFRLLDPSGAEAARWEQPLGDLLPGSRGESAETWNSGGAPSGTWRVVAEVRRSEVVRATAETWFDLTTAVAAFAGRLDLSDQAPVVGEGLTAAWQVTDLGGTGASELPVHLSLRRAGVDGELAAAAESLDLAPGERVDGTAPFATDVLGLGDFVVVLQAGDADPRTLDTAAFSTRDGTPPDLVLEVPGEGAVVASETRVLTTALDALSPVHRVELRLDGGEWRPLELADPAAALWRGIAAGLSEGEHRVEVRATDAWGNVALLAPRHMVADLTPPRIVIRGVTDGGEYADPVTPSVEITDAHPGTESIRLDGEPFPLGRIVGEAGEHELVVVAQDRAGNRSEQRVVFRIVTGGDPPPPAVPEIPALRGAGLTWLIALLALAGALMLRRRRWSVQEEKS